MYICMYFFIIQPVLYIWYVYMYLYKYTIHICIHVHVLPCPTQNEGVNDKLQNTTNNE